MLKERDDFHAAVDALSLEMQAERRLMVAALRRDGGDLEKLKEIQWNRHQNQQAKRETQESDEMSTVRYVFERSMQVVPV